MVNVTSIYLLARYGVPEIKKRGGGAIINLASVQGYACQRGVAAYATSKGAVHSLTRALALDHASDHIRVNFPVKPGIDTHADAGTLGGKLCQYVAKCCQRWGQAHPLGRIGTPEEVAELAAFPGIGPGGILHRRRLPGRQQCDIRQASACSRFAVARCTIKAACRQFARLSRERSRIRDKFDRAIPGIFLPAKNPHGPESWQKINDR